MLRQKLCSGEHQTHKHTYTQEWVLKVEHLDIVVNISDFGIVLERQGKFAETEAIQRRASHTQGRVLGSDHPDISVSGLGIMLEKQRKLTEVEATQRRALRTKEEKVLEPELEYPDTESNDSYRYIAIIRIYYWFT